MPLVLFLRKYFIFIWNKYILKHRCLYIKVLSKTYDNKISPVNVRERTEDFIAICKH